jgi:hypothetical protein
MTAENERPLDRAVLQLSHDEEVTLRRVAFGQSEVRALRAADLDRLRQLYLIENGKDGPQLTSAGKVHFASLPKGVFASAPRHGDYRSAPEVVPGPPTRMGRP